MAEEIRLHVVSTADSKGLREAAGDYEELRGESDKLSKSLDKADQEASDLSDTLDDSSKRAAKLRSELARTVPIIPGRPAVAEPVPEAPSPPTPARRVSRDIIDAPDFRAPRGHAALIGVLIAAGVAAAPTIGAIVAGAVAGAIGTGGVAGGVLMAMKDRRVKSAARQFGEDISAEFFRGEAFVAPIIRSLDILKDAFADMDVPEVFEQMAPHLVTIVEGLADMGRNIMPGLNEAFSRMAPFARVAAEGFADMGSAIGEFADNVTESEGAIMGLKSFFDLLNGVIRITGGLLRGLSMIYEDWVMVQTRGGRALEGFGVALGKAGGGFRDLGRFIATVGENTQGATADFAGMGGALKGTAGAILDVTRSPFEHFLEEARENAEGLAIALDKVFGTSMAAAEAADNYVEGLDKLREALKENGRTIDINTEKGRANRDAFREAIRNAQDWRDINIRNGMATSTANAKYAEQVAVIEGIARAAGVTKKELEKLAGRYAISVLFTTSGRIPAGGSLGRSIKFDQFQHGGTTPVRRPFWVGEHEPELLFSNRQHFVATKAQMARSTSGGGVQRVEVVFRSDGTPIGDFLMEHTAGTVRNHGGRASLLGIKSL